MTIAEGLGDLALIAGVFTRLVALPLIVTMVGALVMVKVDVGSSSPTRPVASSTPRCWRVCSACSSGPGRVSVDGILGMETATAPVSVRPAAERSR